MNTKSIVCAAAMLLCGCATHVFHGKPVRNIEQASIRILMPPFVNATSDDHADRALTELTGTALLEHGFPLYQTEELLIRSAADNAAGPEGRYTELAQKIGATHLLIGTVHEYRYKTDLDGDPAVGITMRLVDAQTGRTVWQGSSANVGFVFASLSSAAQHAVRVLVPKIPRHPPIEAFGTETLVPSAPAAERPQSQDPLDGSELTAPAAPAQVP